MDGKQRRELASEEKTRKKRIKFVIEVKMTSPPTASRPPLYSSLFYDNNDSSSRARRWNVGTNDDDGDDTKTLRVIVNSAERETLKLSSLDE